MHQLQVTIHTINESKLLRQQSLNLNNDIQITRIPPPNNGGNRASGISPSPAAGSSMSLQQLMQLKQHEQQQLHLANMSPNAAVSRTPTVTHNEFINNRPSLIGSPVSVAASSESHTSLHDINAKRYLHEYQLGQLQRQMHDLQIQSSPSKQQRPQVQQPLSGDFGGRYTPPPLKFIEHDMTNNIPYLSLQIYQTTCLHRIIC